VPRAELAPEVLEEDGRTFRLSAVIATPVFAAGGKPLGECHDVWAQRTGPKLGEFGPALRVHSLLVGGGAFGERLGYHHGDVKGPWLLKAFFQRMHRSACVVEWDDIASIDAKGMHLRPHVRLGSLDDFDREHADDGIFLGLRVLDSQVVDAQGKMCGEADDLRMTLARGNAAPYASAILTGPGALAHRIGGRLGLWIESVYERLHPAHEPAPASIPFDVVRDIGNHVQLSVPRSELNVSGFEDWVRDRIIGKIPGATRGG
jgi:hypothetical protein